MLWKLKEMEYVEKIVEKISIIGVKRRRDMLVEQLKQICIAAEVNLIRGLLNSVAIYEPFV